MASSLSGKRMFLLMLAAFGLVAAVVCGILLATGVREPTRERLFLVGSLVVVSVVCIALSFAFKGQAAELDAVLSQEREQRRQRAVQDPDQTPLPQNAGAAAAPEPDPDPDDIVLPQNQVPGN